mmetsp:Transcript_8497/g.13034  ORF Transcript_8497/g.13034 Transcript_8497/m.13034 type:complete len:140 (-) Transcript_8497:5417-5836(-)
MDSPHYLEKLREDFGVASITPENYWIMRINTLQRDAYLRIYNDYLMIKNLMDKNVMGGESTMSSSRYNLLKKAVINKDAFWDLFRTIDKELFAPDASKYPMLSLVSEKDDIMAQARKQVAEQGEGAIHDIPVVDYNLLL